jgi:hypothetical protein
VIPYYIISWSLGITSTYPTGKVKIHLNSPDDAEIAVRSLSVDEELQGSKIVKKIWCEEYFVVA